MNTRYNVEMQNVRKKSLGRRSRYYHSQIDMELLLKGTDYSELPDTYVIFICDFDPFYQKKYRYTFEERCNEAEEAEHGSGAVTIYLSTHGENEKEVPEELVRFLRFVKADLHESVNDFEDEFVKKLQNYIRHVKESREMGERYMIWHEMLQEERNEGRIEGKIEGKIEFLLEALHELGPLSLKLEERILSEKNTDLLSKWMKLAVKSDSLEQFIENM